MNKLKETNKTVNHQIEEIKTNLNKKNEKIEMIELSLN